MNPIFKILFLSLILISCKNKVSTVTNIENNRILENANKDSIIKPVLYKKIIAFINDVEESAKEMGNSSNCKIYLISFYKEDNLCSVQISTSYCYLTKDFKGYIMYGDKMIAFYSTQNTCSYDLINFKKLYKKPLSNYYSDTSLLLRPHDPRFKIFNIIDKDHLWLRYEKNGS